MLQVIFLVKSIMISITRKGLKVQFKERGKLCHKNSTKLSEASYHAPFFKKRLEYIFNGFEHKREDNP